MNSQQTKHSRLKQLRTNRALNRAVCCALLFGLFWLISWKNLDNDFGWHLMAGNYFRAHGIPKHDIFTYTARNFPWIDHEWGNDVIVSVLYGLGGYNLSAVLYGLLWSSALMIIGWRVRLTTLLIAAVAMLPYAGIRPIAWTLFFMAILLRILQTGRRRWQWAVPLLFIPWANLHGGFVVGLALILYFALKERRRPLLFIFVLSTLATFVNAYGPRLYVEIARTLLDPTLHSQVAEWARFSIPTASATFVLLWTAGLLLFVGWQPRRWLRLSTLLMAATLSATRYLPVFVIGSVQEVDGFLRQAQRSIPRQLDRSQKLVLAGMLAGLTAAALYGIYVSFWPLVPRDARYPNQAIAYLQTHGCDGGHLFNTYGYGGYLIWKLPSQPVYIDGRMPSWRDPSGQKYMTRYYQLLDHPNDYQAEFSTYNIRCAVLSQAPLNTKMIATLKQNHWRVAVQNDDSILLLHP